MKIGIFGLPLAGKKTIFRILAGMDPNGTAHKQEPVEGFAQIDDPRMHKLQEIYNPKRTVKARIYLKLLPDFEGDILSSGKVFPLLGECDALCHIVRVFSDSRIYHTEGSVNPERDIRNVNSELLLHDLEFVEKRIEKLRKERKAEAELELMRKLKTCLEDEKPLRIMGLQEAQKKIISGYPFLTLKPMITVLNLGDGEPEPSFKEISEILNAAESVKTPIRAKLEAEINELPPGREREEMLEAMGLSMPAAEALKKVFLETINLITFFTASSDELRQWLTDAGSTADKAAGKIHSDMQRGFIKAEVIQYEDLVEAGSEEKAASMGKKMLKGRNYTVNDGDIMSIRFNV